MNHISTAVAKTAITITKMDTKPYGTARMGHDNR